MSLTIFSVSDLMTFCTSFIHHTDFKNYVIKVFMHIFEYSGYKANVLFLYSAAANKLLLTGINMFPQSAVLSK